MKKIFLIVLCGVLISTANAQDLVLATYQYADNNRKANIQPVADHIAKKTGLKVEVKSYASVHLFIAAIQNNEVDIALINTFGYLLLDASAKKYQMRPYVVLKVKEGAQDNYKTAVIAPADFTADTLSDIKIIAPKSNLMLVNPGSTSGNLVPRLALISVGIEQPEKVFRSVKYGKNHKATLDSILLKKADIGAIGSSEYLKYIHDPANAKNIKVLWMSPEIPLGPVLIHEKVRKSLRDSVISIFTELDKTNPAALQAVKNGWSEAQMAEKYIKIGNNYYLPFQKQLGDKKKLLEVLKQFVN